MSRRRRPCGRYATASWTYETPTARSAPDDPGFSPVRTGAGARNRARLAAGDHRTRMSSVSNWPIMPNRWMCVPTKEFRWQLRPRNGLRIPWRAGIIEWHGYAIEGLVDVVERCRRVHMPGALVYARPRMGKTHAVDYLCLHLARERPDVLTIRMSANIIGGFRRGVLQRAPHCCGSGARFSEGQIAEKRQGLIRRLREALAAASRGHVVALFCDEGAAPVEKQLRLAQRCP